MRIYGRNVVVTLILPSCHTLLHIMKRLSQGKHAGVQACKQQLGDRYIGLVIIPVSSFRINAHQFWIRVAVIRTLLLPEIR